MQDLPLPGANACAAACERLLDNRDRRAQPAGANAKSQPGSDGTPATGLSMLACRSSDMPLICCCLEVAVSMPGLAAHIHTLSHMNPITDGGSGLLNEMQQER